MVFWEMGLEATKARKMPWPVSSLEQNFRYSAGIAAIGGSPAQSPRMPFGQRLILSREHAAAGILKCSMRICRPTYHPDRAEIISNLRPEGTLRSSSAESYELDVNLQNHL